MQARGADLTVDMGTLSYPFNYEYSVTYNDAESIYGNPIGVVSNLTNNIGPDQILFASTSGSPRYSVDYNFILTEKTDFLGTFQPDPGYSDTFSLYQGKKFIQSTIKFDNFSHIDINSRAAGDYTLVVAGTANPVDGWDATYVQLEGSAASVSPVPLPSAVAMFGTALLGLMGLARVRFGHSQ